MNLVYIAGKYAGDVEANVKIAREAAKDLWQRGFSVICPHLNTYGMEKDTKLTHRQFLDGDFEMIKRCDAIIMLPNWVDSPGATEEHMFAIKNGIPVFFYPNAPSTERINTPFGVLEIVKGPQLGAQSEATVSVWDTTEERRELKEGVKYDEYKLRFDLIPTDAWAALADIYTYGANKYADRNWEKGIDFHRVFGALLRHTLAWWDGEDMDPESKKPHMAHAAWNAIALLHFMLNHKKYEKFDNRPRGV